MGADNRLAAAANAAASSGCVICDNHSVDLQIRPIFALYHTVDLMLHKDAAAGKLMAGRVQCGIIHNPYFILRCPLDKALAEEKNTAAYIRRVARDIPCRNLQIMPGINTAAQTAATIALQGHIPVNLQIISPHAAALAPVSASSGIIRTLIAFDGNPPAHIKPAMIVHIRRACPLISYGANYHTAAPYRRIIMYKYISFQRHVIALYGAAHLAGRIAVKFPSVYNRFPQRINRSSKACPVTHKPGIPLHLVCICMPLSVQIAPP